MHLISQLIGAIPISIYGLDLEIALKLAQSIKGVEDTSITKDKKVYVASDFKDNFNKICEGLNYEKGR